jgi:type IV pilus assembly protein PilE
MINPVTTELAAGQSANSSKVEAAGRLPQDSGFSLVELMIVVAIVGILAAVALPAYNNSVLRGGRAEGQAELLQVAAEQERFFSGANSYSTDATPLVTPNVAGRDRTTQNGLWTISVDACGAGTIATCFVATATAVNAQVADSCDTLTLSNTGIRGATGDTVNECWR